MAAAASTDDDGVAARARVAEAALQRVPQEEEGASQTKTGVLAWPSHPRQSEPAPASRQGLHTQGPAPTCWQGPLGAAGRPQP